MHLVGEVVLAGELQFYRPALIGGDLGKVAVPAALVDIEVGVDLVGADVILYLPLNSPQFGF